MFHIPDGVKLFFQVHLVVRLLELVELVGILLAALLLPLALSLAALRAVVSLRPDRHRCGSV